MLVAAIVKCGYRLACLRACVDHVGFVVQTMTATGLITSYSRRYICVRLVSAVQTECVSVVVLGVLFRDTASCCDCVAP